ncbi:MAG: DUF3501 family protein [Alphaproteobacteria bacterium]|nr:DUF3501 family protein [Alphaproteobacteria bacterium]MBV8409061.1 DUF3501 family protein [Alphaproteobacteria bacterium]
MSTPSLRKIETSAILPLSEYGKLRGERRRQMAEIKRLRRMEVGPFATFYFESYETMLHQVHEMLFIEKGGPEQILDELAAYNPLIPQGDELVATIMFEIDDPLRRERVLGTLGGIEHKTFLRVGGELVRGVPEEDQERSRDDGKASSVQFVHFPFASADIRAFRSGEGDVIAGFDHPDYSHMAVMPPAVRRALSHDFD